MGNNSPIYGFVSLLILFGVVLFPLRLHAHESKDASFEFPPDSKPAGLFDLYKNQELIAENIPVWRPLNFFPRANDFVSNQKCAKANIRLQLRKAVREGMDTGLESIRYESIPNPYYGKFSWSKPAKWSRHEITELPVQVKMHPDVSGLIQWIDVFVNGKSVIFRQKFDQQFTKKINLKKSGLNVEDRIEIKVRLLDRWGNSVTTPSRSVHVEG